jgi:hypothetical protein
LLQSNQFDTTWSLINTSLTSGQAGYDGSSDAWLLTKSASSGYIRQNNTTGGVQTYSVYAKANSLNWITIEAASIGNSYFNLANGVKGTSSASLIDANIEDVGGGWYRCSITYNTTISQLRIFPADGNLNVGGTSGSIYIQDAQLESGLVSTSVIETGASTAQAGILEDMPRLDYSGGATCPSLLLEPQRTNIHTNSEYLDAYVKSRSKITSNAATSPEGVSNASKIIPLSTSNGWSGVNAPNYSFTSGQTYTLSIFAKAGEYNYCQVGGSTPAFNGSFATINLTNGVVEHQSGITATTEDYGSGWWKISFTHTAIATASSPIGFLAVYSTAVSSRLVTQVGDDVSGIYAWGWQAESGSYPTSYIPTYGVSSVTRSGDSTETATPSTSLFNQTEGVIYAEWENVSNGNSRLFNLKGGGHQIYIKQFGTSSERIFGVVYNGSGNVFSASTPNNYLTIGDTYKVALRYKEGEYAFYVNGTQIATSAATGLGSMAADKIDLENNDNAGSCKHKQAIYFPTALTDTELASLTTL